MLLKLFEPGRLRCNTDNCCADAFRFLTEAKSKAEVSWLKSETKEQESKPHQSIQL